MFVNTEDHIVERLPLDELAKLELNNFQGMEKLLFNEVEQDDPNRFSKFWDYEDGTTHNWTVIMPFNYKDLARLGNPQVAYQINHYVLWMTIAYLCSDCKPLWFMDYNKAQYIDEPISSCWACEYAEMFIKRCCDFCPIWPSTGVTAACSKRFEDLNSGLDGFVKWIHIDEDTEEAAMLRREYATKVATYPWKPEKELKEAYEF